MLTTFYDRATSGKAFGWLLGAAEGQMTSSNVRCLLNFLSLEVFLCSIIIIFVRNVLKIHFSPTFFVTPCKNRQFSLSYITVKYLSFYKGSSVLGIVF